MTDEEGQTSISIHALREEGDGGSTPNPATVNEFLSTPSVRRATDLHRPQDAG